MAVYSAYCLPAHRMPGKRSSHCPVGLKKRYSIKSILKVFRTRTEMVSETYKASSAVWTIYTHWDAIPFGWIHVSIRHLWMPAMMWLIFIVWLPVTARTMTCAGSLMKHTNAVWEWCSTWLRGIRPTSLPGSNILKNENGTPIPTAIFGQMTPRYVLTDSLRETLNATEVIARITLSASLPWTMDMATLILIIHGSNRWVPPDLLPLVWNWSTSWTTGCRWDVTVSVWTWQARWWKTIRICPELPLYGIVSALISKSYIPKAYCWPNGAILKKH